MARSIHFRHLRTRLAVLYTGLFAAALLLVALAVVTAVTASARQVVQSEMTASGAVYGQVWESRSAQLGQGATVLARDSGFRQAITSGDETTVRSILDDLRRRQKVDGALLLGMDGQATATGLILDDAASDTLLAGLRSGEIDAGVLTIDAQPYQAVAAPVMAPTLIGWVVFAQKLDAGQMQQLEGLSAIPLTARVLTRSAGGWQNSTATKVGSRGIAEAMVRTDRRAGTVRTAEGEAMSLVRPLPSFDPDAPAALLLTYPMKLAMQPYRAMMFWLASIGSAGLLVLLIGTWSLALGLTRPISALDKAVHRLQQGEHAEVPVTSNDEIGRLAANFNVMAGDIRDREVRLTQMALHDQETGLPNRLALERRAAAQNGAWVILFSVDRFEVVRNAIGYDSMARLLGVLGERLSALGDGAAMARVGAGALGMIVEADDDAAAEALAEALCEAADTPILLNGAPVDIALTAGLSCTGRSDPNIASAVDRAAVAVDQARAARRPAAVFDSRAYGDPGGNLSLISELMEALNNGEFSLNYQPKYDFRAEAVTAVEALARWTHPRRGVVAPDLFVSMAEETGHIRPLTEWVVRQSIRDHAALRAAGHDLILSVNISGRLLADDSFADFALAEIAASDARLCFEITETAVMDNPKVALAIIDRFAAAGVAVSIDDYGSGLSSLAYLKQIRADELKIDKSFILTLDQSARDGLLVKSTIDLAHGLGLKVTAEGVETQTALALLRGMGCDMAQGYLIGRPMPLAALIQRLDGPAVTDAVTRSA
ncbi:EAL domain-containing protein [uncultured Brevundimonas sp.]|uniref:putative bifunctional diguanylate cyclase/phosphodiesterase n=1 Tax=uncultured Brevundimonas sp. TaxID=213418 RepID=UPI0030EDBB08|tara:strand:+ start:54260 stop:56578 length:2319 start_codon:yes stop_codon:yes gene_type:complete